MSYSQVEQDTWVLSQHPTPGFFLDIGAHDGIHYSNTKLLEENGWNGLCVEANPDTIPILKSNRTCDVVQNAIGDEMAVMCFNPDGMSSKLVNDGNTNVDMLTFKELFEFHKVPNHIDYMSIDIEGYEYQALSKFPFDTHTIGILTVEHNKYLDGPENKQKLFLLLTAHGYVRTHDNVSHQGYEFEDWYKHNSLI